MDVKRFLKEKIRDELVPALEELVDELPDDLVGFSDVEPDEISTEKLFDDIEQQLIAWNVMFDPPVTLEYPIATECTAIAGAIAGPVEWNLE